MSVNMIPARELLKAHNKEYLILDYGDMHVKLLFDEYFNYTFTHSVTVLCDGTIALVYSKIFEAITDLLMDLIEYGNTEITLGNIYITQETIDSTDEEIVKDKPWCNTKYKVTIQYNGNALNPWR